MFTMYRFNIQNYDIIEQHLVELCTVIIVFLHTTTLKHTKIKMKLRTIGLILAHYLLRAKCEFPVRLSHN